MTAIEIELAVAKFLNWRTHLIIPNVSWSLFEYEMDMAVITKSNRLWEVEIKVSKSDLKADLKKRRQHNDHRVSRLYFAIPESLVPNIELIPERAGVLMVLPDFKVIEIRKPKILPAPALDTQEINKLQKLLSMRIWGLKRKLIRMRNSRQTHPARNPTDETF